MRDARPAQQAQRGGEDNEQRERHEHTSFDLTAFLVILTIIIVKMKYIIVTLRCQVKIQKHGSRAEKVENKEI
ncbi:MAG TPA: hypothetical protein IAC25_06705 [Candidatus Enterenecus stercoripullorum]|nr:hypothetical protein [Candidatus Enterenecus stercoripullorum]